jgi:hypothetical protein
MKDGRGRLVFAAGATVLLVAAVAIVAVSGSSTEESQVDDQCLQLWNDDSFGTSDGVHAYRAHGYSDTLVTRIDSEGEVIAEGADAAPGDSRCAVIFAAPTVDQEPEFGVRVYDQGRWAGLALVDRVPLDQIEAMQREATATANATLLPDGRLAAD